MAQAAEVPFGGTLTSDTAVVTLIPIRTDKESVYQDLN